MRIETELLISILKLTRDGSVSHEVINKDARVPIQVVEELLQRLQNDGLLYVQGNVVKADQMQHLKLAIHALRMGADLERVSGFLQWREFEGIAAIAFERNGYKVRRNVRFKHEGRRREIDIVACKKPLVVCVDCKHWHHRLHRSALERIVKEQIGRTRALAKSLPSPSLKIECVSWTRAKYIPVILSLVSDECKFFDGVPIVPVLQVQDFLNQLPAYADSLLCITSDDLKQSSFRQKEFADKTFRTV